ncbi:MAG: hypothetical protein ABIJ50_07920 [Pseudomonadota bacterium]
MLYVERDQKGKIVAIRREADTAEMELKEAVDDEILEFLVDDKTNDSMIRLLASTDAGGMRILEDLINLLVRKNIIMSTELPHDAQIKLRQRRQLRQRLDKTIIVDDII